MGGIVECTIRKNAVVQCACSRRRLNLSRDTLGLTDSWLQFFAETGTSHLMIAPVNAGDTQIGLCSKQQGLRWLCHRRDGFQVQVGREQTKCSSTGKLASLPRGYAGAMNRRSYYMRGRTMQRFRRLSKVDGCGYLGWTFSIRRLEIRSHRLSGLPAFKQ